MKAQPQRLDFYSFHSSQQGDSCHPCPWGQGRRQDVVRGLVIGVQRCPGWQRLMNCTWLPRSEHSPGAICPALSVSCQSVCEQDV
jgi:hypothetical protein